MSPRTREQNEEIRKQRKQQILQSAISVYAEKGYAASEIGEIAERVGLARGLIYHYYKNKQALFRELHDFMMNRTIQFTKSHFEQEGSSIDLFHSYARNVSIAVLETPEITHFYMRISLDVHYLFSPEEYSPYEWIKEFMHPMAQAIEKGISQKTIRQGDANLMAMQFWGAVSHGTDYLDQLQKKLTAPESSEASRKEQLQNTLEQIIDSAVAILRPV